MPVAIMIFVVILIVIWILTLFYAEKLGDSLIKLFKRIVFGKETDTKENGGNENV